MACVDSKCDARLYDLLVPLSNLVLLLKYSPKGLYSFIVLFILEVSRTLIPVFHCRLNLAPSITQYVPTTSAYTSKISKQSDVG